MKTPESALNDFSASYWLKDAVRTALDRDPVDALNDAAVLYVLMNDNLNKIQAQNRDDMSRNQTMRTFLDECSCESGLPVEYDARGIPLGLMCDKCRDDKLKKYLPEISIDSNYEYDEKIYLNLGSQFSIGTALSRKPKGRQSGTRTK
jgi:hypothetical protein